MPLKSITLEKLEEMRERDFATALDLLVAGIEAMVAREE